MFMRNRIRSVIVDKEKLLTTVKVAAFTGTFAGLTLSSFGHEMEMNDSGNLLECAVIDKNTRQPHSSFSLSTGFDFLRIQVFKSQF